MFCQKFAWYASGLLCFLVLLSACSSAEDTVASGGDADSAKMPPQTVTDQQPNQNWNRFRGPTGMGTTAAKDLPTEWSESDNIKWKMPLPGAGASSPIVLGQRIYLTCYTGYQDSGSSSGDLKNLTRHLLCIDGKQGEVLWQKSIKAKLPEEERIRDHGYAGNTPVADSERVYVFFGKSGVYAFDHEGNQQWQTDVGNRTHGWGSAASPILHKNLLIVNASVESESVVALNKKTGEVIWRAPEINEAWNTPIVAESAGGRSELIVPTHGKVRAFDPATGHPLWTCATDITWYMVPCAVADRGIVYVLGGRSGVAALAVRMGGRGDVTSSHRLWTSRKGSNVTSPVLRGSHLYWAHEKLGIAYCAKVDSGKIVYQERLNRAGQIYASALLADGRVYYLNRRGRMFVVAAKPEFELLATNDLADGSVFNATPAVMGQALLVRSDKFLYCIAKSSTE